MDTHQGLPVDQEILDIGLCPLKVLVVLQIHVDDFAAFVFSEAEYIIWFQNGRRLLFSSLGCRFTDDADE